MLPSTTTNSTKRDTLQNCIEKAEKLEELIKLFNYIDIKTTKSFLSSAIEKLSITNINSAYFGYRNIEEILCRELLIHIFSFLYIFERFKYCLLSKTFYNTIYYNNSNDIIYNQIWISFDHNINKSLPFISDMLFLYEKQYPTYFKINPFKNNGNALNYLLNKLYSNINNLKIGAQGITLINKIFNYYSSNNDILNKLQKWISNLHSIAFIANDINTINSFLLQYKPKLIYLSLDSIRYNTTNINGIYHHHFNHNNNNSSNSTTITTIPPPHHTHQYLSDEFQEGYDAPQPTPTPAASASLPLPPTATDNNNNNNNNNNNGNSSSSFIASPTNNNNGTNTLSSDYSDHSDDDDGVGGIHSFYAIHESSDGYHHEGHYHSFKFNHNNHHNHHNHNHHHTNNHNNHHVQNTISNHNNNSSSSNKHRVFRNSHSSSIHHKSSYHHRYKNKRKSNNNSSNSSNSINLNNINCNGTRHINHRIPISFKYQHNIHNMIHNMMTTTNLTTTTSITNGSNLNLNGSFNINQINFNNKNGINDENVIIYDNIRALQIFSSYSEIRISTITYLMKSISYLGIDINIQKQYEIQKLQEIIYDKYLSPNLNHLSITDFKDIILIPNRIHSLVIQRWFTNLSNLQFESQFFPYNINGQINNNNDNVEYYLSLNQLNQRLHSIISNDDEIKKNGDQSINQSSSTPSSPTSSKRSKYHHHRNGTSRNRRKQNKHNYVSRLELGMGIDPLSSSDCTENDLQHLNNDDSMDEIKHIESDILNQINNAIIFNNNNNDNNNNHHFDEDDDDRMLFHSSSLSLDDNGNNNNNTRNEKRIYLNTNTILPNTTSQLFEIKLLLNFDIIRNRWIILKEQYEFLLRLRCIESLQVIHFVMVHQSVLNKHSSQYYSISKTKCKQRKIIEQRRRNENNRNNHKRGYNKNKCNKIDENDVIEIENEHESKDKDSLSPKLNINGNIHNLHSLQNNNKKFAIYDFPIFNCKWHKNKDFYIIAPKQCIKNKIFKSSFPLNTKYFSFNPMIKNKFYDDQQWILRKKLKQISDLFSVGLPNQLQNPS